MLVVGAVGGGKRVVVLEVGGVIERVHPMMINELILFVKRQMQSNAS